MGCRWAPRGAPWLPGFREASRFSGSHGRGFLAFENDRGNLGGHRVLEICFRDAGQTIRGSQVSRRFISSGKNNPWLLGDLNPGA